MTETITRTVTLDNGVEMEASLTDTALIVQGFTTCESPSCPRHMVMEEEYNNPTGHVGDLQLVVLDDEIMITVDGEDVVHLQVHSISLDPEEMQEGMVAMMLMQVIGRLSREQRQLVRDMLDALDSDDD